MKSHFDEMSFVKNYQLLINRSRTNNRTGCKLNPVLDLRFTPVSFCFSKYVKEPGLRKHHENITSMIWRLLAFDSNEKIQAIIYENICICQE